MRRNASLRSPAATRSGHGSVHLCSPMLFGRLGLLINLGQRLNPHGKRWSVCWIERIPNVIQRSYLIDRGSNTLNEIHCSLPMNGSLMRWSDTDVPFGRTSYHQRTPSAASSIFTVPFFETMSTSSCHLRRWPSSTTTEWSL